MKSLLKLAAAALMGVCVFDVYAMNEKAGNTERIGERFISTGKTGEELPEDGDGIFHSCRKHYCRDFSYYRLDMSLLDDQLDISLNDRRMLLEARRLSNILDNGNYDLDYSIGTFCDWWWHDKNSLEVYEFMFDLINNKLQHDFYITNATDLLSSLRNVNNFAAAEVLPAFFGDDENSLISKLSEGDINLTVDEQRVLLRNMGEELCNLFRKSLKRYCHRLGAN